MMKRFFIVILLFCSLPLNAMLPALDGNDDDPEKINLEQQHNNGEGPTSLSPTQVNAYKTNTLLTVEFVNFTGNAVVSVVGINGYIVSDNNFISGSGVVVLDIASLADGQYMLFVQANQVLFGFFTK